LPNRATAVETPQRHTFVTLTFLPITTTTTTTNAQPPSPSSGPWSTPMLGPSQGVLVDSPPLNDATHHHRHVTTRRSPTTPPIANPAATSPSNYGPPRRCPFPTTPPRHHPATPPQRHPYPATSPPTSTCTAATSLPTSTWTAATSLRLPVHQTPPH